MLKAVDGSFDVPTAEAVMLSLRLAPVQTPPHTRPAIPLQ